MSWRYHRRWHIPYDRRHEHAAALRAGMTCMPANFVAQVCPICDGKGEYEQTFRAGCGGGYYRSGGDCAYCQETGMVIITGHPAPVSVVEQVLTAGRRAAKAEGGRP